MTCTPVVHAELQAQGERTGKHRVARLIAQMGLVTKGRRRFKVTTRRDDRHRRAQNVLAGDFSAQQPNDKWVSDITYIPTAEGWLYLAGIEEVFSRRIVGWSMDEHPTSRWSAGLGSWRLGSTGFLARIIPTKAASTPVTSICACWSKTT